MGVGNRKAGIRDRKARVTAKATTKAAAGPPATRKDDKVGGAQSSDRLTVVSKWEISSKIAVDRV